MCSAVTTNIQGTFLSTPSVDIVKRKWESDKKHLISLELHVTTLSEYYRAQRIPRVLRTHLRPSLLPHNTDFCKKFEAISNKFSFDIILLNIEYLQIEMETYKKRIDGYIVQLTQMM